MKPMKARDLRKLAKSNGWELGRNPDGSHTIYTKNGHHITIPGSDNTMVSPGTTRQILKKIKEVG
jgi:predicted RNA binding protein YcfA (HicA-like mRNA interferase family)